MGAHYHYATARAKINEHLHLFEFRVEKFRFQPDNIFYPHGQYYHYTIPRNCQTLAIMSVSIP